MTVHPVLTIDCRAALYRWFQSHHATEREFWIRVNRSRQPEPGVIAYVDAVEVALCFGWIDSTLKRVDEGKPMQRFTPRRPGSPFCAINRERCIRLIADGQMTPAGYNSLPPDLIETTNTIHQDHP